MEKNEVYLDLLKMVASEEQVKIDEKLSTYTFTRTGGKADLFVLPKTYEEVGQIVAYAGTHHLPLTILGKGSNLIVRDGGIRGIVVNCELLNEIRCEGKTIIAQSGASIIDVSRFALAQHLTGLEFACGIPGSVGGALFMNAGAYGGETADVLYSAVVVDKLGNVLNLDKNALQMGYRHSAISQNGYLALEGTFTLSEGDPQKIKAEMDRLTELRELKQPLEFPSCGSVFKRPPGHFAGKLIQDSGLQGTRIGGVEVSTKHAGFMVNVDNGTASDYIQLIRHVQKTVKKKFNVDLETEVRIIGEEPES
ncbi:UDP-N-acetylmuramate dehydrogenase [Sporolactobacillus laevolacticus]|uniref:UDP-N-acetylenolpyruvoylglucosamine reductase n=1 Tax=Sporolactobacillus laevolacticus DSM 442 TaxID=1395513 RepID=V6IW42_9BACL|nr:UDP-N-acetylmuramate dehydrogenase [Sporolactobacillus laevolacticus]EST11447.1 UDP-N-acetylenolpyruvoylglucosamine reductase [Sporolactobacillus laevolacticus DSM 442]MDN3956094.1 UDP-N-acetylmuramate dehydrogenase [Sporolactobacillus laevolacticus]